MSLYPDMWNPLVQPSPILGNFLWGLSEKKKPLMDSLGWFEAVPLYFSLKRFEIFKAGGTTLHWGFMVTLWKMNLKITASNIGVRDGNIQVMKQWFTRLWELHRSPSSCLQGQWSLFTLCFQCSGHTRVRHGASCGQHPLDGSTGSSCCLLITGRLQSIFSLLLSDSISDCWSFSFRLPGWL